jgi:glutamine synthetase
MSATHGKEPEAVARALADKVVPALEAVRDVCDCIEAEVDDALWPLPKYREMLFVV